MQAAKRLEKINEYYFSKKLREIDDMNKAGKQVINLGIGSPDMAPHKSVIETLAIESAKPEKHAYQSYKGSPILREAIANWYKKYYDTDLNFATEILPLIGSKEGIMHICMSFINKGDMVFIPNPGYPTYSAAATIAEAKCVDYNLLEENNFQPDIDDIENKIIEYKNISDGKILFFLNYPHMPTGESANEEVLEKLVEVAKKYEVLIIHDNPYSFILNKTPKSIFQIKGASDVALELNSLSKSHNMAGWRVGMVCGKEKYINEILRFKSNMDSGMFLPLQLAAATALSLDQGWFDELNAIYSLRREKVYNLLQDLNCDFNKTQSGLFVWAKIPANYADGYALSDYILQNANVFITPGGIFGSNGNSFIRVSLCANEIVLDEALLRIKNIRLN